MPTVFVWLAHIWLVPCVKFAQRIIFALELTTVDQSVLQIQNLLSRLNRIKNVHAVVDILVQTVVRVLDAVWERIRIKSAMLRVHHASRGITTVRPQAPRRTHVNNVQKAQHLTWLSLVIVPLVWQEHSPTRWELKHVLRVVMDNGLTSSAPPPRILASGATLGNTR